MQHLVGPCLTELLEEPTVRQLMARDGTSGSQVREVSAITRLRIETQRRRHLARRGGTSSLGPALGSSCT
jgi:hypothetical protein